MQADQTLARHSLIVVAASFPIACAQRGFEDAFLLASLVLFSLLILEVILFLVSDSWLKGFRSLLSLLVVSTCLQAAFLFVDLELTETTRIFSICILSAFLLGELAVSRVSTLRFRLKLWSVFWILSCLLGAVSSWRGSHAAMPAIACLTLAASLVVARFILMKWKRALS